MLDSEVKSTTLNDILVAAEEIGKNYSEFKIAQTRFGKKLIFGTFDEKGFSVSNTDMLSFNVKVELNDESDVEQLQKLAECPVYYGEAKYERENEFGEKERTTLHWMTISKVCTFHAQPSTAIDLQAFVATAMTCI